MSTDLARARSAGIPGERRPAGSQDGRPDLPFSLRLREIGVGLAQQGRYNEIGTLRGRRPRTRTSSMIYLDNNATTRTDPRVVEAMLPYFTRALRQRRQPQPRLRLGGRGSGRTRPREQVASLIGAAPREIVFTSGATESNNLALKGVAAMYRHQGDHIITAATEHKAVLDPCQRLEREGFRVTFLPVDARVGSASSRWPRRSTDRDHPGQHHGGQQRDRHAAADRAPSAGCARSAASCSTPTRSRRPARCRSTWRRWASTC